MESNPTARIQGSGGCQQKSNGSVNSMLSNELLPLPDADVLVLRTTRLDLIPITRDLAPEMFLVLNDYALYEYVTGVPPTNLAALTRQYEFWEGRRSPDRSELWLNWALRVKDTSLLIGHVQAGVSHDHADMAWILGSPWQHLGYATEAAKAVVDLLLKLGVREIRASINPIHSASIGVAERLGLQRTDEFNESELIWKRLFITGQHEAKSSAPTGGG
jgi:RimJ/RimL family protein N-acetyltransferase